VGGAGGAHRRAGTGLLKLTIGAGNAPGARTRAQRAGEARPLVSQRLTAPAATGGIFSRGDTGSSQENADKQKSWRRFQFTKI